jgi:hypothetical protein
MASNTTDLTLTNGTFDANGFNVTIGQLLSSGATARTLLMGSGLWTIGPFNNISAVNINPPSLTFNAGTANINWFGGGPTTNVWQVNTPLSFNDLTIYGSALPGNHFARFTGAAHTFNNMRFDTSLGPLIVDFGTSTATRHTLAGLSVNASNAVPVQFFNSLWLYPAGPIIASGTITVDHAVMFNITASGGATFNATNTLDVGNNTGWASITPPSGGGSGAPGHANMSGGLNG